MGVAFELESPEPFTDETPPVLVVTRAAQWTDVYSNWRFVSLISINKTFVALVRRSNLRNV
jgi:hypothetical protein